jgi:hypothetical protein
MTRAAIARSADAGRWLRALRCLAACALVHCDPNPGAPREPAMVPSAVVNADLVPAPLDSESARGSLAPASTDETPRTRAERAPLPFDLQRPPDTDEDDADATHTGPLLSLEAHWAFAGQTVPTFPGLDAEQAELARVKATTRHLIDLLPSGRMRMVFQGGAFTLDPGSTLLARAGRTGWLLVWPDNVRYRALSAGSLLSVLREARADVTPSIAARIESERPLKERRFGFPLLRTQLTTQRGTLTLEQIEVPEAGSAGVGLCRLLLELIAASPTNKTCNGQGLAVRAHFEFPGTALDWVVDSFKQRTEGFDPIEVPPRELSFQLDGLPSNTRALLTEAEAGALRKGERRGRVRIANRDAVAAFLTLDNAPIAFVAPRQRLQVEGLPQGELRLGVRDFLGVELSPVKPLKLEASARVSWGLPNDAGAPL